MIETFPNSIKATVLQVLSKANRKFLDVGRQLNYKVIDSNPMNDTFNVEITPDDSAKLVTPTLSKYKTQNINSQNSDKNIRQVVKEVLIKHIFNVK